MSLFSSFFFSSGSIIGKFCSITLLPSTLLCLNAEFQHRLWMSVFALSSLWQCLQLSCHFYYNLNHWMLVRLQKISSSLKTYQHPSKLIAIRVVNVHISILSDFQPKNFVSIFISLLFFCQHPVELLDDSQKVLPKTLLTISKPIPPPEITHFCFLINSRGSNIGNFHSITHFPSTPY